MEGRDEPPGRPAGWDPEAPVQVVRETLLSRRPHPGAGRAALAGVAVLLAMALINWSGLAGPDAMSASRESVFERGQYWRLLTSLGAHADAPHLLANAALFALLAFLLFGYYGAGVFPLLAVALGAATTALTLLFYPPQVWLLGASGMVYAMAGLWLALYLLVERRLRAGRRLLRAGGFAALVLLPSAVEPRVSYRAHATGFLLGAIAGGAFFAARREALRGAERLEWD